MRHPRRVALLFTFAAAAIGALTVHQTAARAQIDPFRSSYGVYESRDGAPPVLLGEIYRSDADPTRYAEHWVLYPGFVNPSGTNGVVMSIRPGLRAYRDLNDFFARVPFARGARYVHVDCLDTNERPVAR